MILREMRESLALAIVETSLLNGGEIVGGMAFHCPAAGSSSGTTLIVQKVER